MTTTNIGDDAANGAMGEREAFERELVKRIPGAQLQLRDADDEFRPGEYEHATREFAWSMWQARAALTAEKVAGQEPIYQVLDPIEGGWSDGPRSLYDATDGAFRRIVYAAPQRPACRAR